jgi:hypothetical protein
LGSIHTEPHWLPTNAEPSMNSTLRGISINSSNESANTSDSMASNCEFTSYKIDESDRQFSKHDDSRISTFRGISID